MITSRANGGFSSRPSLADGNQLDHKTAESLVAKDQHEKYQELDKKAVLLILLLDYIVYKVNMSQRFDTCIV